jgi:hypothetical protein
VAGGEHPTRDALPILQALIHPAITARPRRLVDWLTARDIDELWQAIKAGQA